MDDPPPRAGDVTSVLAGYHRVLSRPGALAFSVSGLVARLPMAMVSLGIVLLVSTRTGSYAEAGAVSAAFLIANALFAVPQARLIDRAGQASVLAVAAGLCSIALVAMMTAVEMGVPAPFPHLAAAVSGAAMPQIGSSVRARWSYLVADKRELHTAFAFESVVDEVVFIVGPALVTVLATTVHPLAGLCTAVVATAAGTIVFVSLRRTAPPATGAVRRDADDPMPWKVLAPLLTCAVTMGALLGAVEVATVARSEELGSQQLSGLMLAVWAVGSLLSGIVTGAVHTEAAQAVRFRWWTFALGLSMLPLPFVDGFVPLAGCLFLSGLTISPTLIAGFAWIEEAVPTGRITEGITMFTTGLGVGLAPGAAAVGLVVDGAGASASFWVAGVAGMLGVITAFLGPRVPFLRTVVPT